MQVQRGGGCLVCLGSAEPLLILRAGYAMACAAVGVDFRWFRL